MKKEVGINSKQCITCVSKDACTVQERIVNLLFVDSDNRCMDYKEVKS